MIKSTIVIQTSYFFQLNQTLTLKTAIMNHDILAFQNNSNDSSEKYFTIHFFCKTRYGFNLYYNVTCCCQYA